MNEESKQKLIELYSKQLEFLNEIEKQWDNIDWCKTLGLPSPKDGESLQEYCLRIRHDR